MDGTNEKKLIELYLSNIEMLEEGLPAVLTNPRSRAIEAFNLLRIPCRGSGNGDRYHYTDLTPAFEGDFEHYFTPSYTHITSQESGEQSYQINFMNGFCCDSQHLTQLDNGIIYGSLAEAARQFPDLIKSHYNTLSCNQDDPISELSTALMQDGAFVFVPKGERAQLPFMIHFEAHSEGELISVFGRNLYIFERGSEANMVIDYTVKSSEKILHCSGCETFIGENAKVEVVERARINNSSSLITSNFTNQGKDSNLTTLWAAISGKLIRNNITIKLNETGANNHTYGLMLSGLSDHFDFNTNVEHLASDCNSNQLFKGIAGADGRAIFAGRIYVAPDAQRTMAIQQNNNLLLGDDAKIHTKPQLEIFADNVKCSHGATVGQMDPAAIYYMRQRGINELDARKLQLIGFVNDVLEKTSIEGVALETEEMTYNKIEEL